MTQVDLAPDMVFLQDEGWFMGLLEGSGAKGAFPINYTRRFTS